MAKFNAGDRVRVNAPSIAAHGLGTVRAPSGGGEYTEVLLDGETYRRLIEDREMTHVEPQYAKGDKVRVTFEGVADGGGYVNLGAADGRLCIYAAKSVEVLEPAEPAWADREGAIVRCTRRNGATIAISAWCGVKGRWVTGIEDDGSPLTYEHLVEKYGPLTLLYDPAA